MEFGAGEAVREMAPLKVLNIGLALRDGEGSPALVGEERFKGVGSGAVVVAMGWKRSYVDAGANFGSMGDSNDVS
jgi:hypothetical protein